MIAAILVAAFLFIIWAILHVGNRADADIDQSELEADMDKVIKRINEGQE